MYVLVICSCCMLQLDVQVACTMCMRQLYVLVVGASTSFIRY